MTTWRWCDAEQTQATDDEGTFAPAGAAVLDGAEIEPFRRFATLEEAKAARIKELSQRRERAERAFVFAGVAIDLDNGTQRRIGDAILGLELAGEPSVRWRVARGVFATFTKAQLEALGAAAFAHVQACFANVETLEGAIEAGASIAAVEAIDLEAGWP